MHLYRIANGISGADLGAYQAESVEGALDALARDAGYADYSEVLRTLPRLAPERDEIIVSRIDSLESLCELMRDAPPYVEWSDLPTFGGAEPVSTLGVWSWDETRLLVGDSPSDLEIVDREEYYGA